MSVVKFEDICEVLVGGRWKRVIWKPPADALMRKHGATDMRYREGYTTYNEMCAAIEAIDDCE